MLAQNLLTRLVAQHRVVFLQGLSFSPEILLRQGMPLSGLGPGILYQSLKADDLLRLIQGTMFKPAAPEPSDGQLVGYRQLAVGFAYLWALQRQNRFAQLRRSFT